MCVSRGKSKSRHSFPAVAEPLLLVFDEVLQRPVIRMTPAAEWQAAALYAARGEDDLYDFTRWNFVFPEDDAEKKAIGDGVARMIIHWRDELYDGFDPEWVADPDYSDCDRLIVRWLTEGWQPAEDLLVFELAWPGVLLASGSASLVRSEAS